MTFFGTALPETVTAFFKDHVDALENYLKGNVLVKNTSGLNNFFESQGEATELSKKLRENLTVVTDSDRREYGDFQTNDQLAGQVVEYVSSKCKDLEFVLEPTCGKGNFLLASIKQWKALKKVVGVEIYQPYVWETKFKILAYFLSTKEKPQAEIDIFHANAFEFPYQDLAKRTQGLKTLVIGNPPWVTNAELSSINSTNLPQKSNFKKHSGFEAITGKGNFDIGEYIALMLLRCFEKHRGVFAFLIKNAVVKNLMHDQQKNKFGISQSEKLNIDSRKEFKASVHACLFVTHLNTKPAFSCKEYDFYTREALTTFGWHRDKFVYSIQAYDAVSRVDGRSKFVWRSGVKHDCSKVMELEPENDAFKNGLGEAVRLEEELLYGLLKSSDLKVDKTQTFRKLTIITQQKTGQETAYISARFPLTYHYLKAHKAFFDKRKSSIYRGKPDFSIFGIGAYSFAPYKVAISGLYKSTHFTLVYPNGNKPLMLDDTCYFIGFESLRMAEIAHYLLNADPVQHFLRSIIFPDAKRSINKDILMRIDLEWVFNGADYEVVKRKIKGLTAGDWEAFGALVQEEETEQMTLF